MPSDLQDDDERVVDAVMAQYAEVGIGVVPLAHIAGGATVTFPPDIATPNRMAKVTELRPVARKQVLPPRDAQLPVVHVWASSLDGGVVGRVAALRKEGYAKDTLSTSAAAEQGSQSKTNPLQARKP